MRLCEDHFARSDNMFFTQRSGLKTNIPVFKQQGQGRSIKKALFYKITAAFYRIKEVKVFSIEVVIQRFAFDADLLDI